MPTAKTESKTTVIRLLLPIRVGKEVVPNNAVLDADPAVADELINADPPCAEVTDAIERYPQIQRLTHVDDYPVTGAERFPLPDDHETAVVPAMYRNETDRQAENQARADGPIVRNLNKPELT